jgi:hypothetical protein
MIVRAMKLDGTRFSSSLDAPNGVNLALFDPTVVEYSNARIVVVTRNEIAYESIQPQRRAPGTTQRRTRSRQERKASGATGGG